ncbi:MAG: ParB/RepB/Spo0J family partition protein [Clostridiales bacterium]|nr:ParB/RepB/Spo0J family partition protein [Clostridiales bacterium]
MPSKKPKPQQEVVVQIPLSELHPFPDHPFQVREDASMQETAESVKEYGVLVPALARPREDGGYELIAGHRRKHACELAGLATMPVIVRDIDRDAATIIMVDSNLQRENILPSERAKAYKMKMEAIKRQGARTDLTSPKISAKFRSDDEVGQDAGVSGDTIRNYIALTQLVPELQQMVDEKKIALSPAYQIASLTPKEQGLLLETIDSEQATPSLSQAQRMKKLSQSGEHLFRERGIHITTLRHPKGFEYLMFDEPKQKHRSLENRAKLGIPPYGNGWPGIRVRWCTGQLKTHLITKEVNRLKGKLPQIPKALVRTSAESPISLAATQADANGAIIPVA